MAGDHIYDRVGDAIERRCDLTICILSPEYLASENCKAELSKAARLYREKKHRLVPVLLADCPIPLELEGLLYADFKKALDLSGSVVRPEFERALGLLIAAIRNRELIPMTARPLADEARGRAKKGEGITRIAGTWVDPADQDIAEYLEDTAKAHRETKDKPDNTPADPNVEPEGYKPPMVFISYSHDSDEHKKAVLRLAQNLRKDGVDCRIDQFLHRGPKEGWPRWMRKQVEESDFVLVVCTERYKRRFEGREKRGTGQGANWEGILIEQAHYEADAINERFLPILLEESSRSAIPLSLRPFNSYRIPTDYKKLLRAILDKPEVVPVEIGDRPTLESSTGVSTSSSGRVGARTRLYCVPRGTTPFVGREPDLEALKELLDRGDDVGVSASIHGLAGIGKTELAIRLARTLSNERRFPGGIYWLDAEQPDLQGGWDAIGERLGIPEGPERAGLALGSLSEQTQDCLLILDNVTSWKAKERPHPLPEGEHVQLLATTRRSSLGMGFKHHPVQVLPEKTARELLEKLGVKPTADGFEDLLAHLDGHALALALAGCYLREFREESPRSYLDKLIAGEDPSEKVIGDLGQYERTVRQSLQLLWDRLDGQTQHHWRVMAQLAPAPASPSLLDACGLDQDARHALGKFSLVEETGDGWKRMHRLVQAFGRRGDTTEAEKAFFEGCCSRADTIELSTGYKVYREDGLHLARAIEGGEHWEWVEPDKLSGLLDGVGIGLQSAGRYVESRDLLRRALALALQHYDPDHPSVATRRSDLATVLWALGDLAGAREHLEFALESDLKSFGPDHPKVATRRSNLATVLKDLGDLAGAREHLEFALEFDLKSFGPDHPRVATQRSNLATVLQALGDLAGAKEQAQEARRVALLQPEGSHVRVGVLRVVDGFNLEE